MLLPDGKVGVVTFFFVFRASESFVRMRRMFRKGCIIGARSENYLIARRLSRRLTWGIKSVN